MDLQQILAAILNPGGTQQNQLSMAGAPAQVGDHNNPALLRQAQQALAPQMPQQAPPLATPQAFAPPQAPQGQPMPQSAPQAAPGPAPAPAMASPGGGIGGFLSGLLQGPKAAQRNHTIGWLQKQGLDEGTATLLAGSKPALQTYLLQRSQGKKPLEVAGKLIDPDTYEVLADFSTPGNRQTATIDGKLVDTNTGQVIGDYGGEDETANIKEYEYAVKNNQFQGSFTDWQTKGVREQGKDFGRLQDVRKEIQGLPSYKNFAQAAPIYETMVDAVSRDSKAADLNLVYGLGKIFDPGSVVREGEMVMVKDTASLPDWLVGAINSLNGGARLQPETRQAILQEARSRINSYKGMLDSDLGQYQKLAKQFELDPELLLPKIPAIRELPQLRTDSTGVPSLPMPPPEVATPAPVAPMAPASPSEPSPQRFGDPTQGVIDWQDWFKKRGR